MDYFKKPLTYIFIILSGIEPNETHQGKFTTAGEPARRPPSQGMFAAPFFSTSQWSGPLPIGGAQPPANRSLHSSSDDNNLSILKVRDARPNVNYLKF